MSNDLIREVYDFAPRGLTPAERLLLFIIADRSQDHDRRSRHGVLIPARTCFPGMGNLTEWTGLTESALRATFKRLKARGLEVRVPLGVDKRGRPFYSAPGRNTVLRLPEDWPAEKATTQHQEGDTTVSPKATFRWHEGDNTVSPETEETHIETEWLKHADATRSARNPWTDLAETTS